MSVEFNLLSSQCHNWLHEDELSELLADSHSRIANQANEVVPVCEQPDDLILCEADFAQAILNLRRRAEPFHAHRNSGLHATERTQFALQCIVLNSARCACLDYVHPLSFQASELGAYTHFAVCATCFVQPCPVTKLPLPSSFSIITQIKMRIWLSAPVIISIDSALKLAGPEQ